MRTRRVAMVTMVLAVFACTTDSGPRQTVGTGIGAAAGGLLGSQFGSGGGRLAMTGVGVLLGALLGSEIGKGLDETDRLRADEVHRRALTAPLGEPILWSNPNTGHSGSITPKREGVATSDPYCREFQQTITVAGKTESGYGTACRQPDGTWRIVP